MRRLYLSIELGFFGPRGSEVFVTFILFFFLCFNIAMPLAIMRSEQVGQRLLFLISYVQRRLRGGRCMLIGPSDTLLYT